MMSAKFRIRFLFLLIAGLLTVLYACKDRSNSSEITGAVRTPVTIIPVSFREVTATIDLPATSKFMNKNIVRATTAGTLENILVRQGDFVASGQLLFTIRTRESAAIGSTSGNDSTLTFNGLIHITANEPGVINSISYQKGDFVQEGDQIVVMSEQKSLAFILDVPFEFQSIADQNRECSIVLPDGKIINGAITVKLPEMEMMSQTVSYVIKPDSPDQLPANLIARVSLIKSSNNNAMVVPKEAVLGNETQTEFWVMKVLNDTTAIRVNIRKGYENNNEIEIIEPGFLKSDRIVVKGNYGLADTAGITIITRE
jgi:multidrug efflux pump subunit AcrA (membrane-fusion protein)